MQSRTTFQFLVLLVVTHLGFAAEPESKALQQRYSGESVRRVEIELPPDTRLKIRTTSDSVISIEGNVNVRFDGSTSRSRRRAILDGIEVVGEMRGNRLRIFDDRKVRPVLPAPEDFLRSSTSRSRFPSGRTSRSSNAMGESTPKEPSATS